MSENTEGADAHSDVERRIRRIGTGASDSRGTLHADADPGTGDAGTDVAQRVRHIGTGGHESPGERVPRAAAEEADADVRRRVRHVGTGAMSPGPGGEPDIDAAREDVERRLRHMGTGARR
jgi:hypothetical protein